MRRSSGLALATLFVAGALTSAGGAEPTNPWTVTIRKPHRADVPFELASSYLRPSRSANYVPGPDSLVARVATVARRAYVEVLDLRTGDAKRLIDAGASWPHWSPDGRYISCLVWRTQQQPHVLTVIDVVTRDVIDSETRVSGTATKWSPDSRMIVGSGAIHGAPGIVLYKVLIPEGTVTVLDSAGAMAYYDFSWSPDSRWIVFSRPTRTEHYGETIAADLWIVDHETGKRWPVLETPDWTESNPLWITNRSIQVDQYQWAGDNRTAERVAEQRVVIELSRVESDPEQD